MATSSTQRIEQLSQRLSSLNNEVERDGALRRNAVETRLRNLDEALLRSSQAEDTKQKLLRTQLTQVACSRVGARASAQLLIAHWPCVQAQEQLVNERAARELLDERKSKELQLVESNAALGLAEEQQVAGPTAAPR